MLKKISILLFFLSLFFLIYEVIAASEEKPEIVSPFVFQEETVSVSPEKTFGQIIEDVNVASLSAQTLSTPTPAPVLRNKELKVALLGDSMIQTMGSASYLKSLLGNKLKCVNDSDPSTSLRIKTGNCINYNITVLNFGVGSTNIKQGLERLPSVLNENPDLVVVESFAYNHGTMTPEEHEQILGEIVKQIYDKKIKTVILATIAPNSQIYGQGITGLSWTAEDRKNGAQRIKLFLQNTINIAKKNNWALSDAYAPSLDGNGEGQTIYIDKVSGIHPSEAGHELVSQKIAGTVENLIKQ